MCHVSALAFTASAPSDREACRSRFARAWRSPSRGGRRALRGAACQSSTFTWAFVCGIDDGVGRLSLLEQLEALHRDGPDAAGALPERAQPRPG